MKYTWEEKDVVQGRRIMNGRIESIIGTISFSPVSTDYAVVVVASGCTTEIGDKKKMVQWLNGHAATPIDIPAIEE